MNSRRSCTGSGGPNIPAHRRPFCPPPGISTLILLRYFITCHRHVHVRVLHLALVILKILTQQNNQLFSQCQFALSLILPKYFPDVGTVAVRFCVKYAMTTSFLRALVGTSHVTMTVVAGSLDDSHPLGFSKVSKTWKTILHCPAKKAINGCVRVIILWIVI